MATPFGHAVVLASQDAPLPQRASSFDGSALQRTASDGPVSQQVSFDGPVSQRASFDDPFERARSA